MDSLGGVLRRGEVRVDEDAKRVFVEPAEIVPGANRRAEGLGEVDHELGGDRGAVALEDLLMAPGMKGDEAGLGGSFQQGLDEFQEWLAGQYPEFRIKLGRGLAIIFRHRLQGASAWANSLRRKSALTRALRIFGTNGFVR